MNGLMEMMELSIMLLVSETVTEYTVGHCTLKIKSLTEHL